MGERLWLGGEGDGDGGGVLREDVGEGGGESGDGLSVEEGDWA